MRNFILEPAVMKTWGIGLWSIFFAFAAIIVVFLWDLFSSYYQIGCLTYYLIFGFIGFVIFYYKNKKMTQKGLNLHVHHYCVSLILVPFICYQSIVVTFMQGFLIGMMIEGGARWGFDPLWVDDNDYNNVAFVNSNPKLHRSRAERRKWLLLCNDQDKKRMENFIKGVPPVEDYNLLDIFRQDSSQSAWNHRSQSYQQASQWQQQ